MTSATMLAVLIAYTSGCEHEDAKTPDIGTPSDVSLVSQTPPALVYGETLIAEGLPDLGPSDKLEAQMAAHDGGVAEERSLIYSPDNKRVAYVVRGQRYEYTSYVVDGQQHTKFKGGVMDFVFSSDGKHYAYIAKAGDGVDHVLIDSEIVATHNGESIEPRSMKLSPDFKRLAYFIRGDVSKTCIVDGKRQTASRGVAGFQFSPDSKHFAYIGNRSDFVIDGKVVASHEDASIQPDSVVFTPDFKRFAYIVSLRGYKHAYVVDGKQQQSFKRVSDFEFSPDGKRYAYIAYGEEEGQCVVDGVAGSPWSPIYPGPRNSDRIIFSPDSQRLAVIAGDRDNSYPIVDGKKNPSCTKLRETSGFCFSPDSKHYAYIGDGCMVVDGVAGPACGKIIRFTDRFTGPNHDQIAYAAYDKGKDKWRMIVNGQAGPEYDEISRVLASPNGKCVAYVAKQRVVDTRPQSPYRPPKTHVNNVVVVDGKSGKPYSSIEKNTLVFSSDSSTVAYGARGKTPDDRTSVISVVNDREIHAPRESLPLWGISTPLWLSSDGSYVTLFHHGYWVNGRKVLPKGGSDSSSSPTRLDKNSIEYFVLRRDKLYRVVERVNQAKTTSGESTNRTPD